MKERDSWIGAFFCACVVVGMALITQPFLERAVNDDWSYARTALDLVQRHRLIYNGQSAMILGPHVALGALVIRVLGFSFTALRLSTLPVAAFCAALLYSLARRCDLSRRDALFASLAILLSPVILPLTTSFMTDISGLFFLLLSIYSADRYVRSETRADAILWFSLTMLTGLLGGLVRQVIWLTTILVAPYAVWLRQQWNGEATKVAARVAISGWKLPLFTSGFSLIVAIAASLWFQRQPFSITEGYFPTPSLIRAHFGDFVRYAGEMLPTFVLLLLPPLMYCSGNWQLIRSPRYRLLFAGSIVLAVGGAIKIGLHGNSQGWPYWGNVFMPMEPFPGLAIGNEPPVLPRLICVALLVLVLFFCQQVVFSLIRWLRHTVNSKGEGRAIFARYVGQMMLLPVPIQLLLVFTVPYTLLIIVRLLSYGWAADRYLIPALPVCVLLLLWHRQRQASELGVGIVRISALCAAFGWGIFLAFATFTVAVTHDYFVIARAGLLAAKTVTAAGIPQDQVRMGFEYDSWNELSIAGHVNSSGLKPEERADPETIPPCPISYSFVASTPHIRCDYFVVRSPMAELRSTDFPPIPYQKWLPPRSGVLYIRRSP